MIAVFIRSVRDLLRCAADRLEGGNRATQNGPQILAAAILAPRPAAASQNDREQPGLARDPGFIGEDRLELGKVDPRLLAGRRLQAPFEAEPRRRTGVTQEIRRRRAAALVAKPHDPPQQPLGRKAGKARDALPQIILMGLKLARSWLARPVNRRLKATVEILARGLAVEPNLARDGGYARALPLQIMDHHDLPQLDHRAASSIAGAASGGVRLPLPRAGRHSQTGEFSIGMIGEH